MLRGDLISGFVRELLQSPDMQVDVHPLQGGLEAVGVSLVEARTRDGDSRVAMVLKPMAGGALREYRVHAAVQQTCAAAAPRILGCVSDPETGDAYVFLEWIPAAERWPWSRREHAVMVLQQLARVHECDLSSLSSVLSEWNYDAELEASAASTVELYSSLFHSGFRIGERPMLRPLERIAGAVVAMRKQAVQFTGPALLHGDAHPGNAVLRDRNGSPEAVLLDWGRARAGSPLEDVMSWIHSLGFWEPQARSIHDSMLVEYRRASGLPDGLPACFRAASWLAGACNAMAGALRYHLAVAGDETCPPETRWTSSLAAADWLRIVRRADAIWRS